MSYSRKAYYMALYGALGALIGWVLAALEAPYIKDMSPILQNALRGLPVGGLIGAMLSLGAVFTGDAPEGIFRSMFVGLCIGVLGGAIGGAAAEGFFFYVFDQGGMFPRALSWGLFGGVISLAPSIAALLTVSRDRRNRETPLDADHLQVLHSMNKKLWIATLIGGYIGGMFGGMLMEWTTAHSVPWLQLVAFLTVGASIGIGRTMMHGLVTSAHFTGQLIGSGGKLMPSQIAQVIKTHSLDGNSVKLLGVNVDPLSQIRMFPASECVGVHARVYPRYGRLWIVAVDGDLFTLEGQSTLEGLLLTQPQMLTDGIRLRIGKAILTYHEEVERG